jgi:hypothetical protein
MPHRKQRPHHTMKTQLLLATTLLLTATGLLRAQGGSLTPPAGPPAPVMRTLDEIYNKATAVETQNTNQTTQLTSIQTKVNSLETRTAVNSLSGDFLNLHKISQSGSYYLNANITGVASKHCIEITADNVTLDLSGFTLIGVSTTYYAINCSGSNVVIKNGTLSAWNGTNSGGIVVSGTDVKIEDVSIKNATFGISSSGANTQISRCSMAQLSYSPIRLNQAGGRVTDCSIRDVNANTTTVLYIILADYVARCTISDVFNAQNGPTVGISSKTAFECVASNFTGTGGGVTFIGSDSASRCVVFNTTTPSVTSGSYFGFYVDSADCCMVKSLQANSSGEVNGIKAAHCSNCVVQAVNNSSTGAVYGIKQNFVAGNATGSSSTLASVITGCVVGGIDGTGIYAGGDSGTIENNHVKSCTGTGISAFLAVMRNNVTSSNGTGIFLSRGYATGNISYSDTTAFSFSATCRYGAIVTGGGVGGFDSTSNFDF